MRSVNFDFYRLIKPTCTDRRRVAKTSKQTTGCGSFPRAVLYCATIRVGRIPLSARCLRIDRLLCFASDSRYKPLRSSVNE